MQRLEGEDPYFVTLGRLRIKMRLVRMIHVEKNVVDKKVELSLSLKSNHSKEN